MYSAVYIFIQLRDYCPDLCFSCVNFRVLVIVSIGKNFAFFCLAYSSSTNYSYFFDFSYRVIVCLVCVVLVYFVFENFVVEKLLLKQFGYFVSQFGSFSFFVFSCGHGSNVISFCLYVVPVIVLVLVFCFFLFEFFHYFFRIGFFIFYVWFLFFFWYRNIVSDSSVC